MIAETFGLEPRDRRSLAARALADLDGLAARHPEVFRPDLRRRAIVVGTLVMLLGIATLAVLRLDVSLPRLLSGFGRLGEFVVFMIPPDFGTSTKLVVYLKALGETLAIAFLGTLGATILALPLGFLAARNVVPTWIFRFSLRRFFDGVRGVDVLIWALVWINVVGLGPFAGVLAILTSDFGTFGKLFSEAIEAADDKPVEGVVASGGSPLHSVRFGLIPQVLPVILSQVLYYFESNTRSATIIGIVGAGGIGLHLTEQIRTLEWQHVSFLVIMILITVALIDVLSSRLRFAVIGTRTAGR